MPVKRKPAGQKGLREWQEAQRAQAAANAEAVAKIKAARSLTQRADDALHRVRVELAALQGLPALQRQAGAVSESIAGLRIALEALETRMELQLLAREPLHRPRGQRVAERQATDPA